MAPLELICGMRIKVAEQVLESEQYLSSLLFILDLLVHPSWTRTMP